MSAKYLLDSTILIDHFNGVRQATEWLSKLNPEEALISVITRAEVMVKAGERWNEVAVFLDEFTCLSIGPDEADLAAGLRNKFRVKLPDAFQAVFAMDQQIALVTRNVDDFKKIKDLDLKAPYHI